MLKSARNMAVTLLVGGVLSIPAVVVLPATAAFAGTHCDNEPPAGTYEVIDPDTGWLNVFTINSSQQTFNVADSRVVSNGLGSPVSVTLSSQVSQTYTMTTTATVSTASLLKFLQISVSNTITNSQTTQLGVNTTFTVPAYGTVQGDYGVQAYNVVFELDKYELSQGHCWWKGSQYGVSANAPTIIEGWHLTLQPTVNPGGVVNGTDYSASDIHTGTTVAIFGQGFVPSDRVVVFDGGTQYSISAGSPYWYDSSGQINATLPNLPPGSATVSVITSTGLQSNAAPITILP